jgi:hypothetical protein
MLCIDVSRVARVYRGGCGGGGAGAGRIAMGFVIRATIFEEQATAIAPTNVRHMPFGFASNFNTSADLL